MTNGSGKPKHLQEFVMTAKGRDFELCSGGEEDEYLEETEVHSPTDSSEDSVEVKISPICLRNKRKCTEPRKVQDAFTAPLKKRMCFKAKKETPATTAEPPFRPWNTDTHHQHNHSKEIGPSSFVIPQPPHQQMLLLHSPNYGLPLTIHHGPPSPFDTKPPLTVRSPPPPPSSPPIEPLSLVKKSNERRLAKNDANLMADIKSEPTATTSCDPLNLRVPVHPHLGTLATVEAERLLLNSAEAFPNLLNQPPHVKISEDQNGNHHGRKEQRNYKNMTRERRIEANARERTRVHTISAAFDTLRRAVPSYSHNQKLSKLSVLRIACSYIMTLSALVGGDSSMSGVEGGGESVNLAECVDMVSKTIQKEGKLRKKKEDSE